MCVINPRSCVVVDLHAAARVTEGLCVAEDHQRHVRITKGQLNAIKGQNPSSASKRALTRTLQFTSEVFKVLSYL